jgi:hypothetical protein
VRADDREHDERVQAVVAAGVQPCLRGERMIGHVTRVEARLLHRTGHLGDRLRAGELLVEVSPVDRKGK